MVWIGLHGVMFLFLFSDFYKQSYINKQKRLKDAKALADNGKVHDSNDNNSSQSVSFLRLSRNSGYDWLAVVAIDFTRVI